MKQHKKLLFAVLAAGIVAGMSGCSTVGNLATSELVAPGLAIGGASLGAFAANDEDEVSKEDAGRIQRAVLRNPGVWILALSSAFMYMSRYAINEWGMFFLQKVKGFDLEDAAMIIAVNTIAGIAGTVFSGWFSDKVFKGDRKYPAFVAGILEAVALVLFLYGGNSWFINVLAMCLFGIAIGVLICFIGGLMAVDLVPRKATGAALGIVGLASYIAAGLMNVISGWLIDGHAIKDAVTGEVTQYDFTYVSIFWVGAAVASFLLPVLNWKRKRMEIVE